MERARGETWEEEEEGEKLFTTLFPFYYSNSSHAAAGAGEELAGPDGQFEESLKDVFAGRWRGERERGRGSNLDRETIDEVIIRSLSPSYLTVRLQISPVDWLDSAVAAAQTIRRPPRLHRSSDGFFFFFFPSSFFALCHFLGKMRYTVFRMYRSRGDPLSQASGPAPLSPLTLSRDDGSMINRGGDFLVPRDFFFCDSRFFLTRK